MQNIIFIYVSVFLSTQSVVANVSMIDENNLNAEVSDACPENNKLFDGIMIGAGSFVLASQVRVL